MKRKKRTKAVCVIVLPRAGEMSEGGRYYTTPLGV